MGCMELFRVVGKIRDVVVSKPKECIEWGKIFSKTADVDIYLIRVTTHTTKVQFSVSTGEDESTDVGAIAVEFWNILFAEFEARLFEGEVNSKVPKRKDSPNYIFLGMAVGHALLNGGPAFNVIQPWAFEVILGNVDQDILLSMVLPECIPRDAASSGTINFIEELQRTRSNDAIDEVVDKFLPILNCLKWEPSEKVTMDNKEILIRELLYSELIQKRLSQLRSIADGLLKVGVLPYLKTSPDAARSIFVNDMVIFDSTKLKEMLSDSECDDDISKINARKFFDAIVDVATPSVCRKILQFATGYSQIPPWGMGTDAKIAVKFCEDDDEKVYPKSVACLHIIFLPTVHSTERVFSRYFMQALDIEGQGYSGE